MYWGRLVCKRADSRLGHPVQSVGTEDPSNGEPPENNNDDNDAESGGNGDKGGGIIGGDVFFG
jgi:hypothetical protein